MVLIVLATAGSAYGAGATTIAAAPPVTPFQTVSGNLATEPTEHQGDYSACQWWTVSVLAHDAVAIAGSTSFGTAFYPPGTTDTNFNAIEPVAQGFMAQGVSWTAPQTGVYPFSVCGNALGGGAVIGQEYVRPFTFTVYDRHNASIYAPARVKTGLSGVITIYVRNDEGQPITSGGLTVSLYGVWRDVSYVPPTKHRIASGHPTAGVVRLHYRLPQRFAHSSITLSATAAGNEFQSIASATIVDRIR